MKLRIKGNSLRLRVTRPEFATLVEGGRIEESIRFGPGPSERLTYVLHIGDAVGSHASAGAAFRGNEVSITLTTAAVRRWCEQDEVGIETLQPLGDGESLHLLVEKDFACIDGPPGSEDPDAFPNPVSAAAAARAC